MNNLFTQDFFRIAKSRLEPGGLFAQWFHIYNMPNDDLRSLLRAFSDVFPSREPVAVKRRRRTTYWIREGSSLPSKTPEIPAPAVADLRSVGVENSSVFWDLHVMGDADIGRFAGAAMANTDDHPWLDFTANAICTRRQICRTLTTWKNSSALFRTRL